MNKHRFTTAQGNIETRNSKTRTYTHVVVGRHAAAADKRNAERVLAHTEADIAYAEKCIAAGDFSAHYGRTECEDTIARKSAKLPELRAAVEADYTDGPEVVLRWSSSAENAHKAANGEFAKHGTWLGLRVAEVDSDETPAPEAVEVAEVAEVEADEAPEAGTPAAAAAELARRKANKVAGAARTEAASDWAFNASGPELKALAAGE